MDWLDYLIELGANGLALGPVFDSSSHGYDTRDYLTIDPRLGTEDDLVHVVEACHARGIRVQLDGVFNHVGRDFPAFRDVMAKKRASSYAGWFDLDFEQRGEVGFGYQNFEGHDALVALNHGDPEVEDHVARVMNYWCERGVDSWRLDAAYAVPATFWARVLPRVRREHPDVWFAGEMIHGDYAAYVQASGIDSVTQYELFKAIWSSLNDHNLYELAHALDRHAALVDTFLPQTFVGNHDVTRIATQLDDQRHLPLALALLLLLPGVPSIYYGDEQGYWAVKEHRAGGDDAIRPAYPATPRDLDAAGRAVHDLHRQLISVRRRNPWVVEASLSQLALSNELFALQIESASRSGALVLNVGPASATVELPMGALRLEAGKAGVQDVSDASVSVTLEPHSFAFLVQR